LGFVATPSARPKTLLAGDELDHSKAKNLKIVLSKSRDDDKFSTVIAGKDEDLVNVYDSIKGLISEEINKKIVSLIPKEDAESGSKSPNNKNLQSEIK
jgi:hypothetical protein